MFAFKRNVKAWLLSRTKKHLEKEKGTEVEELAAKTGVDDEKAT